VAPYLPYDIPRKNMSRKRTSDATEEDHSIPFLQPFWGYSSGGSRLSRGSDADIWAMFPSSIDE